jgi:hypothetical protein
MKAKTLKIVILFLFAHKLCAQNIYFPDVNFKNRLLQANATNGYAWANYIVANPASGISIKIDANNDGEIQQSEALQVSKMDLFFTNISDLTGLEYFTNLRYLRFGYDNVTTFNFPTLVNLEVLGGVYNNLQSINLSNYPLLFDLGFLSNQLTNLDFSGLPSLKIFVCKNNPITTLDFSNNPNLAGLGLVNNLNLASIKIKNNAINPFGASSLWNECWSNNPNLNYICADSNEIAGLQAFLAGCGVTQAITINSACALSNDGFLVSPSIGVAPNPSGGVFNLTFRDFASSNFDVGVFNLLGQKVFHTKMLATNNGTIDLSSLPAANYVLKIDDGDNVFVEKIVKK